MRAQGSARRRHRRAAIGVVAALASAGGVVAATAAADGPSPPAPCNGTPQITDVAGDGHHSSSDVLSAWWTEGAGRLQAVIQVRSGTFVPEHSDAEVNGSGFAMLFTLDGRLDYIRTRAAPDGTLSYDYGTYSSSGYFTSVGATTGSVVHSAGAGTTTIDVPAALGATSGKLLSAPFVLTYDGITGGVPAWVDHAPGGEAPDDPARGADYVVGSCAPAGAGGGGGGSGAPGPGGTTKTTAVLLSTPARIVGRRSVLIGGSVVPARGGVKVTVTRSAHAKRVVRLTTEADGSFAVLVPVAETTRVQALADGIHSGSQTIDVASRVTVRRRHRSLRVRVDPALPGRALLLRPGSPFVAATRRVSGGRATFAAVKGRPLHGRYQVVYVPAGARAERSTSRTVRVP